MGLFTPVSWLARGCPVVAVVVVALVVPSSLRAEEASALTLADVVTLARDQAPEVQLAAFDVDDARARRAGAELFASENPSLSAIAGPRLQSAVVIDGQATLSVPFELGMRRGRALDLADADVRREQSSLEGARRDAIVVAVAGSLRVLHAQSRLALTEQRAAIALKVQDTAIERERVGDASRLEVNLARTELARSTSAVAAAARGVGDAATALADALGLEPGTQPRIEGSLSSSSSVAGLAVTTGLAPPAAVVVARAEVDAAGKDVALAETGWWPAWSGQGQYSLDDGSHIAMAGVGVTLPLFDNGQQRRAEAAVRITRGQAVLQLSEARQRREQQRSRSAFELAAQAFVVLDNEALPRALENEGLAAEAWSAGKIDLPTLLLLQRDALATREEHLERLLEQALAALDVVAAGEPET